MQVFGMPLSQNTQLSLSLQQVVLESAVEIKDVH